MMLTLCPCSTFNGTVLIGLKKLFRSLATLMGNNPSNLKGDNLPVGFAGAAPSSRIQSPRGGSKKDEIGLASIHGLAPRGYIQSPAMGLSENLSSV